MGAPKGRFSKKNARRAKRRAARRGEREMNLKDLRYFVAVYEAKGFSRASRSLGTVQSNVSARILGLERSLGEPLFERRWRGVTPTGTGDQLYSHAKQVIAALDQVERTFGRSRAV